MSLSLRSAALAAIIVLGTYEAALRVAAPNVDSGQDQFATNSIRLENYVDHAKSAAGVVVGSSLTAGIPTDAWPKDWQVLSQSGGNSLVGLEVIANTRALPKMVLIEINALDTPVNADDVANAVSWPRRNLRSALWLTRTANRPVNLLVWSRRPLGAAHVEAPAAGFALLLAAQRKSYALPPDARLTENLRRMKEIVDRLKRASVEVVFFEMPVDRELVQTPRAQGMRRAARSLFPQSDYCWLALDGGGNWRTIDGIHLVAQDARRAAQMLAAMPCIGNKSR
jgi:hypothetical protein